MSVLKGSRPVVAIDGRRALSGPYDALGRYAYHVITELAFLTRPYDLYVYGDLSADPETLKRWRFLFPVDLLITPNRVTWEQMAFPQAVRQADMVHAFDVPPLFSRVPQIITVLDVPRGSKEPLTMPWRLRLHEQYRSQVLAARLPRAALVLAASDAGRQSLLEGFSVKAERIWVVPGAPAQTETKTWAKNRTVVALADPDPRWNLAGVLEVFQRAAPADFKLVLVLQRSTERLAVDRLVRRWPLSGRVEVVGPLLEAEWAQRLAEAAAFLYLPMRDGAALPVLDAMILGTPVIAWRGGASREFADGDFLAVSTVDEAARALSLVLSSSEIQQKFIEEGRKRALAYHWKDAAKRTHDAYLRVLTAHQEL
jgi:glycosyltransferase involved in cell wall biosynthesis